MGVLMIGSTHRAVVNRPLVRKAIAVAAIAVEILGRTRHVGQADTIVGVDIEA